MLKAIIKGQVLVDFIIEFSLQTVSPEQGCLVSTHKAVKSLEVASSTETKLTLGSVEKFIPTCSNI